MHSLKCEYPKMTAKGIKKRYIEHHVRHSAFVDVLRKKRNYLPRLNIVRIFKSVNHVAKTVEIEKVCLSPFDTKRYVLEDGITTLAYRQYKLR